MTLDSLPDLDTSGLCLVKTLSFHGTDVLAVSEHGAPGRRPNIHAHFVGRQREDGLDTLPARAAEANRSTLPSDIGTWRSGTAPEHPRALRRSPKGGRPRYTAGPRRRRKPKHSHFGHPVPGPWKRRSQAVRERKTSVLRPCRVPNPAKRLNVVQRPKTLFEPQRSMTSRS